MNIGMTWWENGDNKLLFSGIAWKCRNYLIVSSMDIYFKNQIYKKDKIILDSNFYKLNYFEIKCSKTLWVS